MGYVSRLYVGTYCHLKTTKIDISLSWNCGIKLPSYIIDMLLKIGKDTVKIS